MAKFCPNCGTGLEEAAKFCIGCGSPVTQQAPPPEPAYQPEPAPRQQPINQLPQQTIFQGQLPQQPYPQQPYPQQPYPQQPYPQQPYPQQPMQPQAYAPAAAAEKPKKKGKGLKILLGIGGGFVALIVLIVVIATAVNGGKAKQDYYELGNDRIPTVKLALGEVRKISSSATSISGGTTQMEYIYNEPGRDQALEMSQYLTCLRGEGFLLLTDAEFSAPSAWCKVGRNSADSGFQLIVQMEYDTTGYNIIIVKEPGEIAPIGTNDPIDPYNPVNPTAPPVDPTNQGTVSPNTYGGQQLWRGAFEDEDGPYVELFYFNKDGTFTISVLYEDNPGNNYDIFGNYTLRGGQLTLTNVETDRGNRVNDLEFGHTVSGNVMTLDGDADYWRVEDEDRADVLADPFIPYPYTSFSAW